MDHSIQGYLKRQSTDRLIVLLDDYKGSDNEYEKNIFMMVYDILEQRGVAPPGTRADMESAPTGKSEGEGQ